MSLAVRLTRAGAALAVALATAAFSSSAMFDEAPAVGGGGGYAFTGSPSAHGMTCATCHQASARADGIDLWSAPAGLFDQGYVPGQTYGIYLRIARERRGLERNHACAPHQGGCNRNGFVAEVLGDDGAPLGAVCTDGGAFAPDGSCQDPTGPTTALLAAPAVSGHSLVPPAVCDPGGGSGCVDVAAMRAGGATQEAIDAALRAAVRGRTVWSFQWRAPPGPPAALPRGALYLAAVDGDGGVSVDPAHNDYLGDDVFVLRKPVVPLGSAQDLGDEDGCSAGRRRPRGDAGPGWTLALALALLATWRWPRRRAHAVGAMTSVALAVASPAPAAAADTSCDITTGASCLWNEGCDCDHDGYVTDKGKAAKYCHFSKCPLDSDDKDASKLGKVSSYNADGDGWTSSLDCDDNDPCVGKTCGASTCQALVDNDKDGSPEGSDCDDSDAHVYPNAAIACCNCAILSDPAKAATFGCAKGCPLSTPQADAGASDVDGAGEDAGSTADGAGADSGGPDSGGPDSGGADALHPDGASADAAAVDVEAEADGGAAETAAADAASGPDVIADSDTALVPGPGLAGVPHDASVGGGVLQQRGPEGGCGVAGPRRSAGGGGGAAVAIAWVLAAWAWRRARRRKPSASAATLAVLALTAATLGGGCVRVQPWQRERLAHRCMSFGYHAGEQSNEQHALQYREGAAGGFGGGGGGCGCN